MKTVGIVGLGLIGGSMARAIRSNTDCIIIGYDSDDEVIMKAMEEKVIDSEMTDDSITTCDMVIIALYPEATVDYLLSKKELFGQNCVIVDCTGVKQAVCEKVSKVLAESNVSFIGGHPMAGIERSGYANSFSELFQNATMILCRDEYTNIKAFNTAEEFFLKLGFVAIKETSAKEHDEVIAYTSQMAHIISSAYIKSDTLSKRYGFSAGSFKDLTRVARLKEDMWTQLFLDNRTSLLHELDTFISSITEYRDAIMAENRDTLFDLLKAGRERKEMDEVREAELRSVK